MVVADFTAVVEAFTVVVEVFEVVAGFAAEALSVAEAGSAVQARSTVEAVFMAPAPSTAGFTAAFLATAFGADGAGVGADRVGAGDSVLAGAGPIGDTPIRTDTPMVLGGELPTMTHTITPTILLTLLPTRLLTTGAEILNNRTQLRNPSISLRHRQPMIRHLPRRTALTILTL